MSSLRGSAYAPVIADVVLGPPGRQRMRASQALLALVVYMLFAVVQQFEVALGLIDFTESCWLMAVMLGGALAFYGVIRSGLNLHIESDPALTLAQTAFGVVGSAAWYAVTGPARGAVLTLQVLILVFAMFWLRPAQSRALAGLAFALLGAVMLWKSRTDALRYPPAVELTHAVLAAIVLVAVAVLAGRMGAMRARLKAQKHDLQHALDRIFQLASRDELTGLVNRRHMSTLIQGERTRASNDATMTIALLDIDLFKRINDSHGHLAGDAVLRDFAAASRLALRANDVLARWGGEEFLLMLPGTTPAQAIRSIERLREGLAQHSFDAVAPGLKVTFSAGLCACIEGDPLEACIERADQAMYRAKTLGRNCTVLA